MCALVHVQNNEELLEWEEEGGQEKGGEERREEEGEEGRGSTVHGELVRVLKKNTAQSNNHKTHCLQKNKETRN